MEALADGRVEPHGAGAVGHVGAEVGTQVEVAGDAAVGGGAEGERELHEAAQPLLVGHGVEVAEVGLGGAVDRGDDLVAALGHGLGVAGHLVQQAAGARGGVVDLVDVGTQLAATGRHAALGLAGTHPVVHTEGVHEELLDLRAGGGLEGRHGGGAHEDAVNRHGREAVAVGPGAGEVVGGPLGCADAAAHAEHHVGALTQHGVGGQQEVVEVLPRVVTTCTAALDLDDHGHVRDLGGDPHDLADLRDRAGLEADVPQAGLGELLDQRDGLIELGDAGGDDHAVEGDAGGAGTLHQSLATDLHLPQVRVEEQRVELGAAAGLEQLGEALGVLGEDRLGDLSATGEFGPVAGVGRGGHDLRVDGGRGHARQQDRRAAGETGEGGLHVDAAVGQRDELRLERRPRTLDGRGGARGEEVAQSPAGRGGHHADALATDDGAVESGQGLARTHVEDPVGAGVQGLGHLLDPIDGLAEHLAGQVGGAGDVQATESGPAGHHVHGRGHGRVVEAHLHVEGIEDRGEDLAAGELGFTTTTRFGLEVGAVPAQFLEIVGAAHHDMAALGVADGHDRANRGVHSREQLVEQLAEDLAVDVGHADHRAGHTAAEQSDPPTDERGRGTDELGYREQAVVDGSEGLDRLHRQHTLRMSDHGRRSDLVDVKALGGEGTERTDLGEQDRRQ